MRPVRVLALAACFAAATAFVGWWTVPVIAGAYALARRHSLAPREAMFAALIAWIALFARQMTQPSFATLLDRLGKLFPVPGIGVVLLALVLATILAWSAARVVTGVVLARSAR